MVETIKVRAGRGVEEVRVVSVAEARDMLGMPEQSIRRLANEGKIGSYPKSRPGGTIHQLVLDDVILYQDNIRGRIGRPSKELDEVPLAAGDRNDGRRYRGRCLEVAREQGMTVRDFALAMGVNVSYTYRVDHLVKDTRNPSPAYRQRAAEVLGVPVGQLFEEIND